MALTARFQNPGRSAAGVSVSLPVNLTNRTVTFKNLILDVTFQTMWDVEIHFNDSIFKLMGRLSTLKFREFCDLLFLSTRRHHGDVSRQELMVSLTEHDLFESFLPAFQLAVYKSWYTDFQIKKNEAEELANRQNESKLPKRIAAEKQAERKTKDAYVDWEGMWSIWHYDFRNPGNFWDSYPCLFYLMLDRQTTDLEQHDLRTALLLCQAYNMNRGKGKKKAKPEDFLIQRRPKDKKRQDVEAQLEIAREITTAFGGRVKPKRTDKS